MCPLRILQIKNKCLSKTGLFISLLKCTYFMLSFWRLPITNYIGKIIDIPEFMWLILLYYYINNKDICMKQKWQKSHKVYLTDHMLKGIYFYCCVKMHLPAYQKRVDNISLTFAGVFTTTNNHCNNEPCHLYGPWQTPLHCLCNICLMGFCTKK